MPRSLTDHERQAFLAEPHVCVLSVASGDDRPPHSVPVWYSYHQPDDVFTFFTGTQGRATRKTALIQQAGAVSLVVQREEPPYKYVSVEGTVIGSDQPPSAAHMLAIVSRYLPEDAARSFVEAELANPGPGLVLFTIRPDHWTTLDFGE